MAEYSRLAKGSFVSTGGAQAVVLPFQPDRVELTNYSAAATPALHGVPFAKWDVIMGQGYAVEQVYQTATATNSLALTTDVVTLNGISTFSAGVSFQFGAQKQISGITKASSAVVTTASAHGYSTGQTVLFEGLYQSASTGMAQIAGMPFVITVLSPTTFSIPWNTNQSNYTALSGSPVGAFVKQSLYPQIYAPGVSFISAITLGSTTTVVTTAPHNLSVGSEVAFRIPTLWGTTQLNSLPNNAIPGSPIYGFVVSVTNSTTVVVNLISSSYTAFNSNIAIASVPGLSFPQMVAVGDVNTGGLAISAGSALYPSPIVNGVSTINGPAINGAFVNASSQGFIIGAGLGTNDTSSSLVGANGNVIYWVAILDDLMLP